MPFSDIFHENNKYKPHSNAKVFSHIEGEWTESLRCDDEIYWHVNEYDVLPMRRMKYILPSDSINREDLKYFINNDEKLAQEIKENFEQLQRDDRKLREKFNKKKL